MPEIDESGALKRIEALRSFQEKLGYFFRDRGLLTTALCHSSYSNENGFSESNERLEFLGDSVLGMIVARVLFDSHPDATEGELSRFRVEFVCRDALVNWAESIGLADVLLKGKSLRGKTPPSVFADAMEAVLGAVFLEGGYDAATRVVRRYLFNANGDLSGGGEKNAKSRLQALLQADEAGLPYYEVVSVTGPSHLPLFHVQVRVAGRTWTGEGTTRKAAELDAATEALKVLEVAKDIAIGGDGS